MTKRVRKVYTVINHNGVKNMVSTATLKQRAKKRLAGNWFTALLVTVFLAAAGLAIGIVVHILQQPYLSLAQDTLQQLNAIIAEGGEVDLELLSVCFGAMMVSSLINFINIAASVYQWLFTLPAVLFFLNLTEGQPAKFGDFTKEFSRIGESLWLYFLMALKIFLWTLLFIIPGIVKTFSYMLAPMIKAKNPNRTANECIAESCRLMDGNKASAFVLKLSFIGWYILIALADMGASRIPWIGTYFSMVVSTITGALLTVYIMMTDIEFYREVVHPTTYFAATAPTQPTPQVFDELSDVKKPSVFGDFYDAPAEQKTEAPTAPQPVEQKLPEEKPDTETTESGTRYAPQQQKDDKDAR